LPWQGNHTEQHTIGIIKPALKTRTQVLTGNCILWFSVLFPLAMEIVHVFQNKTKNSRDSMPHDKFAWALQSFSYSGKDVILMPKSWYEPETSNLAFGNRMMFIDLVFLILEKVLRVPPCDPYLALYLFNCGLIYELWYIVIFLLSWSLIYFVLKNIWSMLFWSNTIMYHTIAKSFQALQGLNP